MGKIMYMDEEYGGGKDYADLNNKPSINNVSLVGNKTASDLGLVKSTGAAIELAVVDGILTVIYEPTEEEEEE